MTPVQAGLCDSCAHQQVVRSGRGSVFSLCRRHKTDDAFPKYPRLPVLACRGFEPRQAPRSASTRAADSRTRARNAESDRARSSNAR